MSVGRSGQLDSSDCRLTLRFSSGTPIASPVFTVQAGPNNRQADDDGDGDVVSCL